MLLRGSVVLLLLAFVVACSGSDGEFASKARLAFDKNKTLEIALSEYPAFSNKPEWKVWKNDQSETIAEASMQLDLNKYKTMCGDNFGPKEFADKVDKAGLKVQLAKDANGISRFYNAIVTIRTKDGKELTKADDSGEVIHSVYQKEPLRYYCSWILEKTVIP